jgi:HK97 family phage prohead protease
MRTTPYPVMSAEAYRQRAREGHAPEAIVRLPFASEVKALSRAERTVRFRITTGAPDRMKDTIDPKGWDLTHYKKNPVVLYAHDYHDLPVGKSVKMEADDTGLSSIAQFATKEQYAFADTVYQLILGGFLKATSVGFKPTKHVYNEQRGGVDFLEQELLEYSVVPIPANPEALIEEGYADIVMPGERPSWRSEEPLITLLDDSADEEFVLVTEPDESRAVPANVSTRLAPKGAAWAAPTLGNFTRRTWSALSDAEKRHIAGHYAWSDEMPPATFGSLKLPHHRASDGAVVLAGVRAAAGRLHQAEGIDDLGAVKAHLRAHYEAFGEAIPDTLKYAGDDRVRFDPADLKAAFGLVIRQEARRTFNKLRGRIDDGD